MQFLTEMQKSFEVVIFTAGLKEYADFILNQMDPHHRLINFRLYRDSCLYQRGVYLKDLSRLGRDLKKTLIIDNIGDNFEL